LARRFFKAGDKLAAEEQTGKRMHPFRVQTKRFRYSLEYFRPCYRQAMDSHLNTIRELQQVLGELNDCCSSRALYEKILGPASVRRQPKLWASLDGLEKELLERFQARWLGSFQSPTMRKKLLRYLAFPPRTGARKSKAAP
jgi:CHAD domain-containing protein